MGLLPFIGRGLFGGPRVRTRKKKRKAAQPRFSPVSDPLFWVKVWGSGLPRVRVNGGLGSVYARALVPPGSASQPSTQSRTTYPARSDSKAIARRAMTIAVEIPVLFFEVKYWLLGRDARYDRCGIVGPESFLEDAGTPSRRVLQ